MRFAIQLCGLMIGFLFRSSSSVRCCAAATGVFHSFFAYMVGDFLTTVVEVPSALGYYRGMQWAASDFPALYWFNIVVMQVLVYAVVMSLIYQATANSGRAGSCALR